jgi:hypothetical protein
MKNTMRCHSRAIRDSAFPVTTTVALSERKPERKPAWVLDTPCECAYVLTMFDTAGGSIQEVDLTRGEFKALKAHLAKMRGYATA